MKSEVRRGNEEVVVACPLARSAPAPLLERSNTSSGRCNTCPATLMPTSAF